MRTITSETAAAGTAAAAATVANQSVTTPTTGTVERVATVAGDRVDLWRGDALDVLRRIPDATFHSVVTDPPYGLAKLDGGEVADIIKGWLTGDRGATPTSGGGFAGAAWDAFVPPPALWEEVLRVLKPGGYAVVFAGARTQDLMALSLRLAGFEIRDALMWHYHSGYPKSADVSKLIDRHAGERLEAVGTRRMHDVRGGQWAGVHDKGTREVPVYGDPVTVEAKRWEGWGSALKPAYEPILLARKPLDGSLTVNVLGHGTGALNIGGCRVPSPDRLRWPANVVYSHADNCDTSAPGGCVAGCPVGVLDAEAIAAGRPEKSPSRWYQVCKPGRAERVQYTAPDGDVVAHRTVKPVGLMRQLVRLVTPDGGMVLEPFAGSGTTVEAALLEAGVGRVVAIEAEPAYIPLTLLRVERAVADGGQRAGEPAAA